MKTQRNVYSVGQVNTYIKNMFTQDFLLQRIYVRGEVSNCKYHPSGHIYFSLKDETGTMPCVMFSGSRKGLRFQMENGQSGDVSSEASVSMKGMGVISSMLQRSSARGQGFSMKGSSS